MDGKRPQSPKPKGLRSWADARYSIGMEGRNPTPQRDPLHAARALLEFKPWMLALAVFLACAIGVTVMEQFRDAQSIWAQVTPRGP
jgi:hypothetical protein